MATDASIRIESLMDTYGFTQPFLRLYKMDTAIFSIMDGVLCLYAPNPMDLSELVVFINMSHDIKTIRSDEKTIRALSNEWPCFVETFPLLLKRSKSTVEGLGDIASLKDLYGLLKEVFDTQISEFNDWYVDVFYRTKQDRFHFVTVNDNQKPISCALTIAETDTTWLLGGVATKDLYRKNGFASTCVSLLALEGEKQGKAIYISPKNDQSKKLYEKLGFEIVDTYGICYLH